MTSPYRLPLHNIDTTDATDLKDTPRYDPVTNTVVWSAAAVSMILAGPGVSIDRTDPSRPVISLADNVQQENPTPTGVLAISGTPSTTEKIITGMDLVNLAPGEPTQVAVNLWLSMNQVNVAKGCTARLRDAGLTGTVLASQVFPDYGDSTAGHSGQWVYTGEVVPTTDRLVVTIQATTGAPTIYSDARYFSATQNFGRMLGQLVDVDLDTVPPTVGDTIEYDGTVWAPTPNEHIAVLAAGVEGLPPGTRPRSLVVRRLP